jgi:dTDP-4-amino-4,6-dideoxygalactose transaminase
MLANMSVVTPFQQTNGYSSFHLYVVRLKLNEIVKTHRQVYESLRAAGILVNLHYIPVYLQPYYISLGFDAGYCPEAEQYYAEALSIPIYPGLTNIMQDQVVAALRGATSL